jgi:hypothetical protein
MRDEVAGLRDAVERMQGAALPSRVSDLESKLDGAPASHE